MFRKLVVFFIFFVVLYVETIAQQPNYFSQLRCEYQTAPLAIDIPNPRFTWITSNAPKNIQLQIEWCSDSAFSSKTSAFFDKSEVFKSKQSLYIYSKKLTSFTRYYWRIVALKNKKKVALSPVRFFETSFVAPNRWNASFIVADKDSSIKSAPLFRKEFLVEKPIISAKLLVCGLGIADVYVNGEKTDSRLLGPAFTNYTKRILYETYDISSQLTIGKNCVGIMVGNGWFNMQSRAVWGFDKAPWRAAPSVSAILQVVYTDKSTQFISTDNSWKCSLKSPVKFNSLYEGEYYDARVENKKWSNAGFDDSEWNFALVKPMFDQQIQAQQCPSIQVREELSPQSIFRHSETKWVIDFGENVAGFVQFQASGVVGDSLVLRYDEHLDKSNKLNQRINGVYLMQIDSTQHFQEDRYYFGVEMKNAWQPHFTYHGYRYVECSTNNPEVLKTLKIKSLAVNTAFEPRNTLSTSSAYLNKLHQATLNSYLSNAHGYPTDCPQREKNGWTADAHIASETGLLNFDAILFYEKWLADIRAEQRTDGMIPAIVPTAGWGYGWGNGPAWDNALILIPWYVYQTYNDTRILSENYTAMKQYMQLLATKTDSSGIIQWGLGDWLSFKTTTPEGLTSTSYYYHDAVLLSKMAKILGKADDEKRFRKLALEIKKNIAKAYFNSENLVANGSQTALACVLHFNITEGKQAKTIAAALAKAITDNHFKPDFGLLGSKFVWYALAENDYMDVAMKMLQQTDYPGYKYWIETAKLTSLPESWNMEISQNHIMFGSIDAWMYRYLAGVFFTVNKNNNVVLNLQPYLNSNLETMQLELKNYRNQTLKYSWEIHTNEANIAIVMPADNTLKFCVPAGWKVADRKVLVNMKYGNVICKYKLKRK